MKVYVYRPAEFLQQLNDNNTVRHVTCVKTRNTALMSLAYCSTCHKQLIDNR